jgi:hypothetical protein
MSGSYKVYRYAATEHLPSTACLLQLLLRLLLLLLLVWLLSVCTVTVCITIVIVTPVPKLPPPVKDAAFFGFALAGILIIVFYILSPLYALFLTPWYKTQRNRVCDADSRRYAA